MPMSKDQFGRQIDYLRISVTDRCNYRCRYCMPEEGIALMSHEKLLSFEDIEFFVRIAAKEGIKNIRLTGGEPLVRPHLPDLIRILKAIDGIEDISITSNAALLPKFADELKAAGLDRVNISLDTLDAETFKYITRRGKVEDVLEGINCALAYDFSPVKLNTVVVRSLKQDFESFIELAYSKPIAVRFIEYMPVGDSAGFDETGWSIKDTIPSKELIETISDTGERMGYGRLIALDKGSVYGHGPASYFTFKHAKGSIGFINALSNHFCSKCNRLRLTSEGKLRPCLFSDLEYDVAPAIKRRDEAQVYESLCAALKTKPKDHADRIGTARQMNQIGG